MRLFILLLLFCFLGMVGCATTHAPEQPVIAPTPEATAAQNSTQTQTVAKTQPMDTASSVEAWDLSALIAVRNTAKSNGDSANLNWQQAKKNYTISLFGPMGSNAVKLSGHPGKVTLEKSNGEKTTAPTPEDMLAKQTGWRLPVSNLFYWIRGLPVPNMPAQKNYDGNNLHVLLQQGWRIQYMDYTKVNGIDLPRKIFLNNAELNIKILISKWQI